MKPSKLNLTRFGSLLSVLSAAVFFTGCYTKLATNDGDHWGYTGPVKQKVVVRETDDTIVVRETRVIHQPQPVVTDTLTYTNTTTGQENVVVNNYFAPAPATFGTYDPWTNNYPTWYDDYWYQPRAAIVISIGDPYHHHHRSRWFNSHWRRHSYYQSHWDYDYYNPWNNWHHASYRGPGWAYYDPYYSYPPMYSYGYGCYTPVYDPFYYGYGYGNGGYYGGHYGGHHGHGHHGYYGDNDHDDDDDGRDRNGRERRRGNVGGEGRGRGGVTTDGGTPNTDVILPRDGSSPVGLPQADRVRAVPVSGGALGTTNAGTATANGGFNGGTGQTTTGSRIGTVDISTGDIPMDSDNDQDFGRTTSTREVKSSPSQGAPGVYNGSATRTNGSSSVNTASQPVERRPAEALTTTRSTSTSTTVVKNTDATNGTKPAAATTTTTANPTPRGTTKSTNVTPAPAASTPAKAAPSYTPRSSGSSNSSVSSSGSGRSTSSNGSSSSGSSSSGSSSRSSDSRGSDSGSKSDDGGSGRGRR